MKITQLGILFEAITGKFGNIMHEITLIYTNEALFSMFK